MEEFKGYIYYPNGEIEEAGSKYIEHYIDGLQLMFNPELVEKAINKVGFEQSEELEELILNIIGDIANNNSEGLEGLKGELKDRFGLTMNDLGTLEYYDFDGVNPVGLTYEQSLKGYGTINLPDRKIVIMKAEDRPRGKKPKAIGETPCVFKKRANGDLTFLGYGTLKSIVKNSMYDAKAQKTLDEKDNLEVYEKDLKDLDKEETKALFNNDNYYGQGGNLNTYKMKKKSRYAQGGNIAKINELKEEIESYELVISSPGVPKDEVDFAKEELKTAKAELAKLEAEGEAKPKRKAPVKKAAPKPAEKARIEYNCEELIEKAKEAKKKRDEAKKAKENEPKKTEATKNKEKIESAAEKVEDSIHNRLEKGEVSKAEIEKLIAETRKLLSALEKALKLAK